MNFLFFTVFYFEAVSLHHSGWRRWYTNPKSTWVNMGILPADYTIKSGHFFFLLLMASSVLLGFSYLNEMYQRIQLQEKMGRQMQRIIAERSVIQSKASLLQARIENKNKEMKSLQDMHTFQTGQQSSSICEKERNDLLQTISSKDDRITEVQTEYESLKQQFESLRSVMEQFQKNQSRILEKFSTQSTQCMNVINMLSELCNKGKGNIIQKIAQLIKQKKTFITRTTTQSSTIVKASVSTLLVSQPQEFYKTNTDNSKELSRTSLPRKETILDSDYSKHSSPKAMQKLQELVSELNSSNSTKDIENKVMKLEKIQNSTEEDVLKSQNEQGGDDDETSDKNKQSKNMLLKEAISQKQTTEQQTRRNKKLPVLNEASKSEKSNHTKIEKVNNSQYPMLLTKNENLQLTNETSNTADRIKQNVMKSQTEKGRNEDKTSDEKVLPNNMLIKETTSQKQTTKQQIRWFEKLPLLNKASKYEKHHQTKIEKVNNTQYHMLLPKNESVALTNETSRTVDRVKQNVLKSPTEKGGNDDKTSDEKDLPNNMLIKETISQKQTTEQQTRRNKKPPPINESEKRNQTKIEKVNNPQNPVLLSKNESLQLTNQNSRTADRITFTKEELSDKPIENITVGDDNAKSEGKAYGMGKILEVQKKPQRLTLEKAKTPDRSIYKANGESEFDDNIEDVEKGLELKDQDILNIL